MAIITIDGPAGSGKSTAARELAKRLGFDYLDTGGMYRCIGLYAYRQNLPIEEEALAPILASITIEMPRGRFVLNGEDVTQEIRTPHASNLASQVAVLDSVRDFLVLQQQQIAQGRNFVCEGRDQGTVVFPQAECKFFLTASAEARAHRRWLELQQKGDTTTEAELLDLQRERDERDSNRKKGALRKAEDAVEIDTSNLTIATLLDRLEEEVRRCLNG